MIAEYWQAGFRKALEIIRLPLINLRGWLRKVVTTCRLKQKDPRQISASLFIVSLKGLCPALAFAQVSDHWNFHCLALISLVGEIQLVKPDQDTNAKAGCNDRNNP